jgi:hypothetical protein
VLFPAVSFGSAVIGLDFHSQTVPPAPPAPFPVNHAGTVFLWLTPQFPMMNVFVNSTPACAVGAMGYSVHIPVGIPILPMNPGYWTRYLTHVAMALTLAGLTIAALSAALPLPKPAEAFVKEVTGIDTTSLLTFCTTTMTAFTAYTKWQTWAKLLMPPAPFPISQGSLAIGSPTVSVNGGAMAVVCPLAAVSCSDIPIVPNATTLGFTNVLVGIKPGELASAFAASAAQAAIQFGLQKGVSKVTEGKKGTGCP